MSGIFLLLQSLSVAAQGSSVAPTDDAIARSIVEKADKVRFPADGFQVDIVINSQRPDKDADMRKYRVLSKGNENTVVMVTEPASERDRAETDRADAVGPALSDVDDVGERAGWPSGDHGGVGVSAR